jgi:hypothetical protein
VSKKAAARWDFSKLVPVPRPDVPMVLDLQPHWVSGFTAGDDSFNITIRSTGQISSNFSLTQDSRDLELFRHIRDYFGCGHVYLRPGSPRVDYTVQDISS